MKTVMVHNQRGIYNALAKKNPYAKIDVEQYFIWYPRWSAIGFLWLDVNGGLEGGS